MLCSYTDDTVIKLFQLTQLTIEYLMNSQTACLNRALQLEQQCKQLVGETRRCQQEMARQDEEVAVLRRDLHQKRKTIRTYEALLVSAGGTVKAEVKEEKADASVPSDLFKCGQCGKLFRSLEYLDQHQSRRHVRPPPQQALQVTAAPQPSRVDDETLREAIRQRERAEAEAAALRSRSLDLERELASRNEVMRSAIERTEDKVAELTRTVTASKRESSPAPQVVVAAPAAPAMDESTIRAAIRSEMDARASMERDIKVCHRVPLQALSFLQMLLWECMRSSAWLAVRALFAHAFV